MVESLSEDEFRKALFESLSKKGIVSSFKSHLRQQLALQLSVTKVCFKKTVLISLLFQNVQKNPVITCIVF